MSYTSKLLTVADGTNYNSTVQSYMTSPVGFHGNPTDKYGDVANTFLFLIFRCFSSNFLPLLFCRTRLSDVDRETSAAVVVYKYLADIDAWTTLSRFSVPSREEHEDSYQSEAYSSDRAYMYGRPPLLPPPDAHLWQLYRHYANLPSM